MCCASVVLLTASHSSIPLCVCAQTLRNFEGFRAAGAARPAQLVAARSRQVRCRPGCPCQRARAHSSVLGACTQRPRLGCGALQAEADWQQGFTALCQLGTGLCWCVAVVPELECAVSAHAACSAWVSVRDTCDLLLQAAAQRTPLRIQAARVGGVEIPNKKMIEFSLQYVYGIGHTTAKAILSETVRGGSGRSPAAVLRLAHAVCAPEVTEPRVSELLCERSCAPHSLSTTASVLLHWHAPRSTHWESLVCVAAKARARAERLSEGCRAPAALRQSIQHQLSVWHPKPGRAPVCMAPKAQVCVGRPIERCWAPAALRQGIKNALTSWRRKHGRAPGGLHVRGRRARGRQGIANKRTYELSEEELTSLRDEVEKYSIEGDLRRFNALNVKRLKDIQCYRGRRHIAARAPRRLLRRARAHGV